MLDGYGALAKVYIFYSQPQSFADSAAKVKERPDKEFVSQIGCCLLHQGHFLWLDIRFHWFSTVTSTLAFHASILEHGCRCKYHSAILWGNIGDYAIIPQHPINLVSVQLLDTHMIHRRGRFAVDHSLG